MTTRTSAFLATIAALGAVATSQAQPAEPTARSWPTHVIDLGTDVATLYLDGSQVEVPQYEVWRFACGTPLSATSAEALRQIAAEHAAAFEDGPAVIVDRGLRGVGVNVVFNTDGSVPSEALDALAVAEAYLEGLFSDSIRVAVTVRHANLGSGVLGATSSSFVGNNTYTLVRDSMQADMDSDDTLHAWLPAGASIPVRYNGNNDTVTNENRIDMTRANYRAVIGSVSGSAGSMTFNSAFNWDYDPSNGVNFNRTSYIDVVVHEVGHALGFVSAADNQSGGSMQTMDIFRFQRSDGCCNYNPDTNEDFQTTPRLVDFNTPNDAHNTDLIFATYRMSDGNPWQASHFREQSPAIGTMDPALASGQTSYPDYFHPSDLDVFDALGYDHPPQTCLFAITSQPQPVEACAGDDVAFSVASDAVTPEYQWFLGDTPLSDDAKYSGALTDTLMIHDVTPDDAAVDYLVEVTDTTEGCTAGSALASLTVSGETPVITSQPGDASAAVGESALFSIQVDNLFNYAYQWRKDGVDLSDDGRHFGANSTTLTIDPVEAADAGFYDCVVTSLFNASCVATSDPATLTIGAPCPGDLDGDGDVDLSDLATILTNFGVAGGAQPEDGDMDNDGDVDLSDLAAFLNAFGASCP